jgi:hypothetical protein
VIDVELYRLEKVLYALLLCTVAIDEVFTCATQHNLACYRYLCMFLETDRALRFVAVVEDDGDAGFCDASLAALVDEIL